MTRNSFPIIFIIVLLLLFSFPAMVNSAGHISEKKVIRVAIDRDLPPFSYINGGGQLEGYLVDLANAIENETSLKIYFIPLPWYQAIDSLRFNQADAVMGMKYTAKRDEEFDFSEPFFTMSEVLIVPKKNESVQNLADLRYRVVAVSENQVAKDILKDVRRVEMNIAMNHSNALQLLELNRAEAFLGNKWTTQFLLNQSGTSNRYRVVDDLIQPADYSLAVQNGNEQLLQEFNRGLTNLKAKGIYDEIYGKWFGKNMAAVISRLKFVIYLLAGTVFTSGLILFIGIMKHLRLIANSNAFKEQILNSVHGGIMTIDRNGWITSMNQRALSILNISETPLNITQLLHRSNPFQKIWESIKEKSEGKCTPETLYADVMKNGEVEISPDDESRIIYYDVGPLYSASGEPTGTLFTFLDRTEEKRMQLQLATQEKMRALGQLVAGIAHELRNPLTAIKTFTELLPVKYHNSSFQEAFITHVPKEINRLNEIVESLLDYSRPKYPKKEIFDLKELIHSIIPLMEATFKKKEITYTQWIQPDCYLYADPHQLKQVFLNLLLNAIDAMERSTIKHLTMEASIKNERIEIVITDSGCGISKDIAKKIFEPFFTRKKHGVGLGLTVSYQLVKENEGSVEVVSIPNKKTSFILRFPLAKKQDIHPSIETYGVKKHDNDRRVVTS
ncbi:transporter substrate-binding domain-containing protein [Microaerobacter geothermalis]|uniref:transporter substrate-binding domain-containing protein n=1 Tax=Microaerobacter geothermalis TaxID=674972 RepID=UPI001F23EDD5|nr:transporter substrate-binding domain-containing protein [Microaerobacter geothermalis]MCF6094587.1 transporter substrate-binding domain-containing protein [Microaerobacter geothermalis]